jgi:hypothetical protein
MKPGNSGGGKACQAMMASQTSAARTLSRIAVSLEWLATGVASVNSGRSSWGAGCVNGARPVLGGGDAQSTKPKLYAKLGRKSPLYSPEVGHRAFTHRYDLLGHLGDFKRYL